MVRRISAISGQGNAPPARVCVATLRRNRKYLSRRECIQQGTCDPADGLRIPPQHYSILGPPRDIGEGVAAGAEAVVVEHDERRPLRDRRRIPSVEPAVVRGALSR